MSRVRIKVCGITRPSDLDAAVEAGVDAVGFVFFERSPRNVTVEQAAALSKRLPPFVSAVGLFVNAGRDEIQRITDLCPLDIIQLHGDETPADCLNLPRRVVKAIRVATAEDLQGLDRYPLSGLLLDAKVAKAYGGTGTAFDWDLLANYQPPHPLILAGGLGPDNVAEAVERVRPFAVDVSSGVESAPGIKDPKKIRRFVQQTRDAEKNIRL
ncbi:MAG: phosphoribosylanthranilate isomerase [Magnetococcales bacterium]|nr:phosphoribosylanthranilate isomerase [Magnetococcales bacterium]